MKIEDLFFEFTPLAWTELYYGYDANSIKSKQELLNYLQEYEEAKNWLKKIDISKIASLPQRIQSLLIGYSILDIGDWSETLSFIRFKMWRLFEDLVYEIFREMLKEREECTILRVDKISGFRGLDFIVINDEKEDWNVGIQCKRYIGTTIPHKHYKKYGAYQRNVSTKKLIDDSIKLHTKFPHKKFVLTTFDVYHSNKHRQNRFLKLKNDGLWDKIMVFNKPQFEITKYLLECKGINQIIRWC